MKKYPFYWLIWSFALILLITVTGEAQNKPHEALVYPPLNQPQPPVPDRFELDNGMIVYLLEDHELPIIDISVQCSYRFTL